MTEGDPLPDPKMPFGKHKGTPLSEVPTGYLDWLISNCELREPLLRNVDDELLARKSRGEYAP